MSIFPENPDTLSNSNCSAHWSKERLGADVYRAVGGALNLAREVSRISYRLDSRLPAERMVKRLQFFAYELQSKLAPNATEHQRLESLNEFFFQKLSFRCLDPESLNRPHEAFCLTHVLSDRAGAPLVLELIYAFLAERIGVLLDFVDLKPVGFLRWSQSGPHPEPSTSSQAMFPASLSTTRAHFVDLTKNGAVLTSNDLIETLHRRFLATSICNANLLEMLGFEGYMREYLLALRATIDVGLEPEQHLFLQDALIAYDPSNLLLIGERALLQRRLGNFKSALSDLKRYFAFQEKHRAPAELVKLYEELIVLLGNR